MSQEELKEQFDRLDALKKQEEKDNMAALRLMRVIVADTDEALDDVTEPEDRVVFDSGEFWFDGSDEEVMLKFGVTDLIKEYNVKRTQIVDKKVLREHGTEVKLEKVRLDDLEIMKVEIAKF